MNITSPEPGGVLVIAVWTDAGEVRRVVTYSEPTDPTGSWSHPLRRVPSPDDEAVVELVRDWLTAISKDATTVRHWRM